MGWRGDLQVDEDLAGAGLRDIELFDLGGDLAGLVVDDGLVLLGDLRGGHGCGGGSLCLCDFNWCDLAVVLLEGRAGG